MPLFNICISSLISELSQPVIQDIIKPFEFIGNCLPLDTDHSNLFHWALGPEVYGWCRLTDKSPAPAWTRRWHSLSWLSHLFFCCLSDWGTLGTSCTVSCQKRQDWDLHRFDPFNYLHAWGNLQRLTLLQRSGWVCPAEVEGTFFIFKE